MSTGKSDLVTLEGELLHETEKPAFLGLFGRSGSFEYCCYTAARGVVFGSVLDFTVLPEWLAIEKRLI